MVGVRVGAAVEVGISVIAGIQVIVGTIVMASSRVTVGTIIMAFPLVGAGVDMSGAGSVFPQAINNRQERRQKRIARHFARFMSANSVSDFHLQF